MAETDPAIEERLIEAVLDAPGENAPLLVYADWLSERGDARADYLRMQAELRETGNTELLPALRKLYPAAQPQWLARLEQAHSIEANLTTLESKWWGVHLREYREQGEGMYGPHDYHRQPPLPADQLDGQFGFLGDGTAEREWEEWRSLLDLIRGQGHYVPDMLVQLMTSDRLQSQIPSCTACYFLPTEMAEQHPQEDGSLFLTFYNDQQSVLLWGVRLGPATEPYAPVLAGYPEWPPEDLDTEPTPYFQFPRLTFVASSVETFLLRWWIENRIWYATVPRDADGTLTPDEQAYIDGLVTR